MTAEAPEWAEAQLRDHTPSSQGWHQRAEPHPGPCGYRDGGCPGLECVEARPLPSARDGVGEARGGDGEALRLL